METTEKEPSIGQIVAKDFRAADVFKKYKIDFCCGGKKTIEQACKDKNIDTIALRRELENLGEHQGTRSENFMEWNLGFLADYIINTHHAYVKAAMPLLLDYTQKVARVHGDRHPEAVDVAEIFVEVANELSTHMIKEEKVLFPYIKQLADAETSKQNVFAPFGTIKNPVSMMEHEHDSVGEMCEKIRQLTNDYTPPAGACATFRVSYAKLKEFEDDLHRHIHLENNILFPRSIKLESQLPG